MGDTGSRKVLVVDDEQEVRAMLAEFLEAQGFEVLAAANGLESLLHVKRARPDAVVLDLNMPRLGGLEALKRIRHFDPAITVVVITGEPNPEPRERALAMGAARVLVKPFTLQELLQAVGGEPAPQGAAAPAAETR